ncbi:MAG: hypothetical protein ABI026_03110, partial [Gemmatimonadaceae bacterium]
MKPLTLARDLQRRRARERTGLFVAEGVRVVEELLASPLVLRAAIMAPGLMETERGTALEKSLRNQAGARGFSVVQVSDRELADCASTDTPQGI